MSMAKPAGKCLIKKLAHPGLSFDINQSIIKEHKYAAYSLVLSAYLYSYILALIT
jgi:hypothetical protein